MSLAQRDPRERDPAYMGWVAKLPCAACMAFGKVTWGVHVAHLRTGSLEHGKRETGLAEKPGDRWTTPLCPPHHTGDKRAVAVSQHSMGELHFWAMVGINPFKLCEALSDAFDSGDPYGRKGQAVIAHFAAMSRKERL